MYRRALRHASTVRHDRTLRLQSNERLEFLGDAVLGMVVAELLYRHFPNKEEGFLTRMRAKIVNKRSLAEYAFAAGLSPLLEMSDEMARAGGHVNESVLADAFEAITGALYLDRGYEDARAFVLRTIEENVDLKALARRRQNYKSMLLEHAQAERWGQPIYAVIAEEGPGHKKQFTVVVEIDGRALGEGRGTSKKSAEQAAASAALEQLGLVA
jgi:ribonuclease-3